MDDGICHGRTHQVDPWMAPWTPTIKLSMASSVGCSTDGTMGSSMNDTIASFVAYSVVDTVDSSMNDAMELSLIHI